MEMRTSCRTLSSKRSFWVCANPPVERLNTAAAKSSFRNAIAIPPQFPRAAWKEEIFVSEDRLAAPFRHELDALTGNLRKSATVPAVLGIRIEGHASVMVVTIGGIHQPAAG